MLPRADTVQRRSDGSPSKLFSPFEPAHIRLGSAQLPDSGVRSRGRVIRAETPAFSTLMLGSVFEESPTWLSRWFGYRAPDAAPPNTTNYVVWIWSFVGAFGGLSVIQALFTNSEYFLQRKVPPIIASYVSVPRRVMHSPKLLPTV